MNAQPLFTADNKSADVWFCNKCKRVWSDEAGATRCCTCSFCENELGKGDSSTSHHQCLRKATIENYDKAVAAAIELTDDGSFVYCERGGPNDDYAENIDAMAEWWEDAIANGEFGREDYPEFVLACTPHPPRKIDTSDLVEWICEDGYEDMADNVTIPEGLEDLLKKFNELNAHLVSWSVNYKLKVRMPPLPADVGMDNDG